MYGPYLEKESSHKIYYLFSFLMIWYGISWYLFPRILEKVTFIEGESGLVFSATFTFTMLSLFVVIGIILFILGLTKSEKR